MAWALRLEASVSAIKPVSKDEANQSSAKLGTLGRSQIFHLGPFTYLGCAQDLDDLKSWVLSHKWQVICDWWTNPIAGFNLCDPRQQVISSICLLVLALLLRNIILHIFVMCRLTELDKEIAAISLPALASLAADPIAGLVDTAYIGRLGDLLAWLGGHQLFKKQVV